MEGLETCTSLTDMWIRVKCQFGRHAPPARLTCASPLLPPTGAAVAGVYRVAGKDMAPLEALVFGVGQTSLSVVISFSRVLATL